MVSHAEGEEINSSLCFIVSEVVLSDLWQSVGVILAKYIHVASGSCLIVDLRDRGAEPHSLAELKILAVTSSLV